MEKGESLNYRVHGITNTVRSTLYCNRIATGGRSVETKWCSVGDLASSDSKDYSRSHNRCRGAGLGEERQKKVIASRCIGSRKAGRNPNDRH